MSHWLSQNSVRTSLVKLKTGPASYYETLLTKYGRRPLNSLTGLNHAGS